MDYGLIAIAVFMFGGCFALNDIYRKKRGSGLVISLQFSLVSSAAGLIILLVMNRFKIEFTTFAFFIALLAALVGFGFTFCGLKALATINLSLYSLFSMLGGMMLPFVQGIVFYNEAVTLAKIICFVFICAALLLTVEPGEKKKGTVYYLGIFILNGLSGVLSKIFAAASFAKTSAVGYSVLIALCSTVISAVVLLLFRKPRIVPATSASSIGVSTLYGAANTLANFLLVTALSRVDASVQYPMVTGGVMIVSTLICFLCKNKPSKKDIVSIALAFIGMVCLFAVPV